MSTPSLESYQASIKAALEAAPILASITVLADNGKTLAAQEAALATKGVVVVVSPCLALRRKSDNRVTYDARALYAVHIRSNPAVNLNGTTGAGLNLHSAVTACIGAVITAHRDPPKTFDAVKASDSMADYVEEDSGLYTYSLTFEAVVRVDA